MALLICEYCGERFERTRKTDHGRMVRFCSLSCINFAPTPCGRPWTVNHTALLLAVAASSTDSEVAELFGRSEWSVMTTRHKFGLFKPDPTEFAGYSEYEDAMLVDLYPHVSNSEVAQLLGRTRSSVRGRALKLGLTKTTERLIEAHSAHFLLPREVRELMALNNKLKKGLRDEEHRRSACSAVR